MNHPARLNVADWVTLGNVTCGTFAVCFAVTGNVGWIAPTIIIGALLDFFDGWIARACQCSSKRGGLLDAFADVITFGVGPVALVLALAERVSALLLVSAVAYVIANVYRHARIVELRDVVLGPTNTAVALVLALMSMQGATLPVGMSVLLLIASVLLVSEKPYINHHELQRTYLSRHRALTALVAVAVTAALLWMPAVRVAGIGLGLLYVAFGRARILQTSSSSEEPVAKS